MPAAPRLYVPVVQHYLALAGYHPFPEELAQDEIVCLLDGRSVSTAELSSPELALTARVRSGKTHRQLRG